jgi:uncharacterized protein (DUF1810 family)
MRETDLTRLISEMRPELLPGQFVFVTLSDTRVDSLDVLASVFEPEGLSGVIRREDADRLDLDYDFIAAWITLRVNSALEAVGLTAAVSARLTDEQISCNVIAGRFHDHLLVPVADAERAMDALRALAAGQSVEADALLARFVEAQDERGTYPRALGELRDGHKTGHWMWFVFPQIAGLGRSETSRRFAIRSLAEARAFLRHPVLGPRLLEATHALLELPGSDPARVLGSTDSAKLRSSMTLFAEAAGANRDGDTFRKCLKKFFDGRPDRRTLRILGERLPDV